jgi:hypothetical protein
MRYKLASGIEIRTENAAKPASQPSQFLLRLISDLPRVAATFDYGCGKLRYVKPILDTTEVLAIIDSEVQLSRTQVLDRKETSIREMFKRSNRIEVFTDTEFSETESQFDRGFCINVLPVIPSHSRRQRVLKVIRDKLSRKGECLFVVLYRNSDFTRMKSMPNAKPFLDGFLVDSLRGHSFYGLIPPDSLKSLLERSGFHIGDVRLDEGTAYVWARAAE